MPSKIAKSAATPDTKEKSAVPAVEKALDVLEVLADSAQGMTMNEIVETLGRTMGELYRVVVYLADRGYVEQNPDTGRYALTMRLFELSHRHEPTERLVRNAIPLLERIADRTEQSCHLGIVNRSNVLVLASVRSPRPASYSVRTGAIFPAIKTSTGNVILAFSGKDTQRRYIGRLSPEDRAGLKERFDVIFRKGYEDWPSEIVEGVQNLCVPVFDKLGVVAALTIGFIDQSNPPMTPEEALTELRVAGDELTQSLGGVPLSRRAAE
ncbi:IclR family transcriptional regulator [Fluviibacterium sp. DFM31]|uniref:IclR family transcriptional regulator n=1 Tax=Meridianimarinicoccus marinus TaxID=3231483 RepID=A0ABV3L904_9RHOB